MLAHPDLPATCNPQALTPAQRALAAWTLDDVERRLELTLRNRELEAGLADAQSKLDALTDIERRLEAEGAAAASEADETGAGSSDGQGGEEEDTQTP